MSDNLTYFNWKEFSLKTIAGVLMGLAVLLLLFFLLVSFIYFPPRGMSSSLENLGLYGDYFGGIVGGVTSIATLGVTIYLAMALHRLEKENVESAIEAQRKIAIMQMKFQELAIFKSQCDKDIDTLLDINNSAYKIEKSYRSFERSIGRLIMLFPEIVSPLWNISFVKMSYSAMLVSELRNKISEFDSGNIYDDFGDVVDKETLVSDAYHRISIISQEYFEIVKKLGAWAAK